MGCVGGVRRVFRLRRTDLCFDLGVLGVAEGPARFVFVLYTCHKNEAAEQQQQQQQQQMASRLKQQLVGLLPFGCIGLLAPLLHPPPVPPHASSLRTTLPLPISPPLSTPPIPHNNNSKLQRPPPGDSNKHRHPTVTQQ